MTERIETMIPILYISVTLMAFYGPNGNLTGNVLLNLWHYQPITDIPPDYESYVVMRLPPSPHSLKMLESLTKKNYLTVILYT